LETLKRAAGAQVLVLCNTNGGSMPFEVARIVKEVKRRVKAPLGIHDDAGVGIANSLMAVRSGAACRAPSMDMESAPGAEFRILS
jgi:2-isopropylmalate synthase